MSEKTMLFIHSLTGLHPGSGAALGVVDFPVQRERHTDWPIIPGSSLKGVLRDSVREKVKEKYEDDGEGSESAERKSKRRKANSDPMVAALFGPERVEDDNAYAGALSVTDARILAFPVRSIQGVFAWVTCPAVLERLTRDLGLVPLTSPFSIPRPGEEQAACAQNSDLLVDGTTLVLEEYDFTRSGDYQVVSEWVSKNAVNDALTRERIKTHLVVLHDNVFTHFVRHATEVVARIGLDYERKSVKNGALFYQEFLPPECLFYSFLICDESRHPRERKSAEDMLKFLKESLPHILQVGGDETIGRGLCAIQMMNGKGA